MVSYGVSQRTAYKLKALKHGQIHIFMICPLKKRVCKPAHCNKTRHSITTA